MLLDSTLDKCGFTAAELSLWQEEGAVSLREALIDILITSR